MDHAEHRTSLLLPAMPETHPTPDAIPIRPRLRRQSPSLREMRTRKTRTIGSRNLLPRLLTRSNCDSAIRNDMQATSHSLSLIFPFILSVATPPLMPATDTLSLKEIPGMARDESANKTLFENQSKIPTHHHLYLGDSRRMVELQNDSVQLIVTSPPYWVLKKYDLKEGQLGVIQDYRQFLAELSKAIAECYRVLIPGGRFVCVVGDVCVPRRTMGKHVVYPLHSDITVLARDSGFDNLTPILWYKISSAKYEANTYSTILGKPYEPNAVIKNDVEFILIQRKPGPYRKPTTEQRKLSLIPRANYEQWFRQIWDLKGTSNREHPAPFPLELATRLVRMYSFVNDTVLDPFVGTGTTMLAAMKSGRNSIGFDIDSKYTSLAHKKLVDGSSGLDRKIHVEVSGQQQS